METGTLKIFILLKLAHPFGEREVRRAIYSEFGCLKEEATKKFAKFRERNPKLPYAGATWTAYPEEIPT